MKKIDIALLIGIILAIVLSNLKVFAQNYDNLKTDVVRLHILANSDSDEDQALKLKVRDKILETGKELFDGSKSVEETERIIKEEMPEFKKTAEQVIADNGYDYSVNCELVNMYFDERIYDEFTLPAGNYDAFRITIGKAEGHNWWCVMYPPLCLPAAMDEKEFKECFTPEEIDMIKNPKKYKVKFKIVELYEKWFEKNNKTEIEKIKSDN